MAHYTRDDYAGKNTYKDTLSKEHAYKTIKAAMASVNSQVDKHEISDVLRVYKKGENFYFQTVEKLVALSPNGAYSMSKKDKVRQSLIQLLDAIEALNHNLFFISIAGNMGKTIRIKERNSEKRIEQFVDLRYLNTIQFTHNDKALENNERRTISRTIPLFSGKQDVPEEDRYLVDKWTFAHCLIHTLMQSKEIILDLHIELEKLGYKIDETIINDENKLFKKADAMINKLKSGEIEVENFRIELAKQFENNVNY